MSEDQALYILPPDAPKASEVLERALSGGAVPDEQLVDALMTLSADPSTCVATAGGIVMNLQAKRNMILDVMNKLSGRLASLDRLMDVASRVALMQCETHGLTRVEAPDGTFSATLKRNPPRVVIDDIAQLPARYVKTELVETPVKVDIREALKMGLLVPGAHLVQDNRIEFKS